MPRYRILTETQLDELQAALERAAEVLDEAGTMNLPMEADSASKGGARDDVNRPEAPPYRISRSGWQYIDVVDREVEEDEFSLDEIWEKLRPMIETETDRPRDGLRTALDRADRYERLEDRDGVWFRRRQLAD